MKQKKYQPVHNHRLSHWPPVTRCGSEWQIACTILDPMRMRTLSEWLFDPAKKVWRMAAGLFFLATAIDLARLYPVFHYIPFEWVQLFAFLALCWVLWQQEMIRCFPVTCFLFGRRIHILRDEDGVTVKTFRLKWSYSQNCEIKFVYSDIHQAVTPYFLHSGWLSVIKDHEHGEDIVEIYPRHRLKKLVENANQMMVLADEEEDDQGAVGRLLGGGRG